MKKTAKKMPTYQVKIDVHLVKFKVEKIEGGFDDPPEEVYHILSVEPPLDGKMPKLDKLNLEYEIWAAMEHWDAIDQ